MKTFRSITQAFDWWIKNIYPNLKPEEKKGRLTTAWRDHTHNLGISEKRMQSILEEYGKLTVQVNVTFEPKE